MKLYILTLIFSVCGLSLLAQNGNSVKGVVKDTTINSQLTNVTVCILNAKDSTLAAFTRTAGNGSFTINKLGRGKFLLLLTRNGYADYIDAFGFETQINELNLKEINMNLKSRVLAEVIIKGEPIAIKIKGDTTEYNAASYKIHPNSKVEDLLKQLPGIQVDKDGKITAQGQVVNKVLLDGEEFFGDDPTLVTQNIRGDMVDKVQVFDKKSDQAAFTGVDDGVKTKTINVKLKEDKKNGYFGKIEAGIGTSDYYQEQAFFNKFSDRQKTSAYGTISNTGKTGLGWEDNSKLGSGGNLQVGDGGVLTLSGAGDELESFDGRYDGQGIPKAGTGGLHYDSKWGQDKSSINLNYKIGSLTIDGSRNIQIQNNLPTQIFSSNAENTYHNEIFRQKLGGTYQLNLDPSSNLKISFDAEARNSQTQNNYNSVSRRLNDTLLNSNNRGLTNKADQKSVDINVFYSKKFKKPGRTFSLNIYEGYNENKANGFLNSKTMFYNDFGKLDSMQQVDQHKKNDIRNTMLSASLTYSESFSKTLSAVMNYGFSLGNSRADRRSYNQAALGQYNQLDSLYSNNYKLNQFSNQAGIVFSYNKNKSRINFGTKIADANFEQINEYTGNIFKRNFINWYPQGSYTYQLAQQKSLNLNYNGNTTQPTIDQMQPIRINTDPLNIIVGNPDLRPSFANSLNLTYNSYKALTGQALYLNGSYSFTTSPIVSNSLTDSTGRTIYQFSNLTGKKANSFSFGGYFDQKIKKLDMNVGLLLNVQGNKSYNFSNNVLNMTNSNVYAIQLRMHKYRDNKYDLNFGLSPTYTISESSLQKQFNNNGRGFNADGTVVLYLPFKLQIISDARYQYQAKTQSFNEGFKRLLWNTTINKKFLKEQNLKLSLSANDIFNQNIGFSRSVTGNTISQNSYNTIRRYFMFSLAWDFNKMNGPKPQ